MSQKGLYLNSIFKDRISGKGKFILNLRQLCLLIYLFLIDLHDLANNISLVVEAKILWGVDYLLCLIHFHPLSRIICVK